jgi:hypothetical protein
MQRTILIDIFYQYNEIGRLIPIVRVPYSSIARNAGVAP